MSVNKDFIQDIMRRSWEDGVPLLDKIIVQSRQELFLSRMWDNENQEEESQFAYQTTLYTREQQTRETFNVNSGEL
jgi:hypothetical protein